MHMNSDYLMMFRCIIHQQAQCCFFLSWV